MNSSWMRSARLTVRLTLVVLSTMSATSCGGVETGVCTGYSDRYNKTYCFNDWTEEECDEWDDEEVNFADWHFHEDQTCSERGTPESA